MKKVIFYESAVTNSEIDLSSSFIQYSNPDFQRIFQRYDFADEWNNLGYGRISCDGSAFAITKNPNGNEADSEVLATFHLSNGDSGTYCGIQNSNNQSTLFFNRSIGPVDGIDYSLIENFLANYQWEKFGSVPVILDIPYSFNSAVTMRVDCDEAIASGKELADLYKRHGIPFSMAITTSNPFTPEAKTVINDVLAAGGSIVTHSETHAPNWGGSREKASWEVTTARAKLKEVLPSGYNFDFVVSPFHQNPQYAVEGLRDAGIKGFVGGIIKNDPEYLVSRASWAKDVPGIMTHSQQCMLHGDCYHATGLSVYKESFDNHYKTNTFFGYLDHPFSNYKYGWHSEEERLKVHDEFLTFLKSYKDVWFANLIDAMSFLWVKVNTKVWVENDQLRWEVPDHNYKNLPDLCVLLKGEKHRIPIINNSSTRHCL